MREVFFFEKLNIDPGVWRVDVPLIVMERCETPHQLCTWIAIRWLRAAYQNRDDFGRREIALRAHLDEASITGYKRKQDQRTTPGWVNELIDLGLLSDAGIVEIKGANPRRCYGIPLRELEDASLAMLDDVLVEWGAVPRTSQTTEDRSALWRPSLPLVVLERCQTPYLISTWLALRWLQTAFPGRTDFASRLLARRARVNQKYLYWTRPGKPSWVDQLIADQLLTDVTDTINPTGDLRERPANARRHTTLPLKELEQESLSMVIPVLASWGISPSTSQPMPNQLAFEFDTNEAELDRAVGEAALMLQQTPSAPPSGAVTAASQPSPYEQAQRMPARPPTAVDWSPLMAPPATLWMEARDAPGERDWEQLAKFASELDATTDGHGWFFVGQAIQAAMSRQDFRAKDNVTALNYIWGTLRNMRKRGYMLQPQEQRGAHGRTERDNARSGRPRISNAADTGAPGDQPAAASRYKLIGGSGRATDRDEHS